MAAAAPAVSNGGRTYRFQIRPGYRFSPPSGQPVTAAAFQRAIERTLHPRASSGASLGAIVGAAAYRPAAPTRSPACRRAETGSRFADPPGPDAAGALSTFYFCAVPPNTPIRPRGLERIAAAGPYHVAESTPGSRLLLRRNPSYAGPRPQRLEAIAVTFGMAQGRAVPDVEAGRADYVECRRRRPRLGCSLATGPAAVPQPRAASSTSRHPPAIACAAVQRAPVVVRQGRDAPGGQLRDRPSRARREPFRGAAGRPTDQHIPPGYPGFRDATIYPLGGPDLATARRLAGGARRRGVLYTCNGPGCIARAAIVRANLAAIGIELEIRQFSIADDVQAALEPRRAVRPVALHLGRRGPGPVGVHRKHVRQAAGTKFLDRTRLGQRLRAASRLAGAERLEAYAALDRDIAAKAAPFAPYHQLHAADFFSARIGCQVEHPLYGIDLAALCIRN